MYTYRNVKTGQLIERPSQDKWLEASAGWERIDEPADEAAAEDNESEDD